MISMSTATIARDAIKAELEVLEWDICYAKRMKFENATTGYLKSEYYFHNLLQRHNRRKLKLQAALKELKHEGKEQHAEKVYYTIDLNDFLNWCEGGVLERNQPDCTDGEKA